MNENNEASRLCTISFFNLTANSSGSNTNSDEIERERECLPFVRLQSSVSLTFNDVNFTLNFPRVAINSANCPVIIRIYFCILCPSLDFVTSLDERIVFHRVDRNILGNMVDPNAISMSNLRHKYSC